MKRSEAFPSKYLSKTDVETPRLGTIDRLTREVLKSDEGDETKTVMYFREEVLKPLILNNVNWMACEDAYGNDSDMWLGKKIELYFEPNVMFGAKRVGGVRVRVPQAAALPAVYTLEQAKAKLEENGLSLDDLKNALKELGRTGYSPARDTEVVQKIITDFLAAEAAF